MRQLLVDGHTINPLDKFDRSPLFCAVEANHLSTATILVNNGGKVNLPISAPHSILFAAVRFGSIEMAQLLLNAGAQLDIVDENGRTAMHYAATRPTNGMCMELFYRGLAVDTPDTFGFTPFLFALSQGATYALDWLIDHGANPKARTYKGVSAAYLVGECKDEWTATKVARWMQ